VGRHGGTLADEAARPRFGSVFSSREFTVLWLAQLLSVAGDQLARVALTVLVYDRTHSPLLAAVAYAASVVPEFLGGVLLSGLADRLPRRAVMIACTLLQAGLITIMTVPGIPTGVLIVLLAVVTLVSTPFYAARAALYADILHGDAYALGTAVTMTTYQVALVAGFALGGAVVALAGARACLIADAATFVVSAVLVRAGVRARPAPQPEAGDGAAAPAGIWPVTKLVFGRAALRVPMLLGWISAAYNVPEGVAAPLAHSLGAGAAAVGLILAAPALGSSAGSLAFGRLVPAPARLRAMVPLAVAACALLCLTALRPGLPVLLLILAAAGICDCYQLAANAAFVAAVPAAARAQAFGLAQGGMSLGQGMIMIVAGALASHLSPGTVIALSGAAGAVITLIAAGTGLRDKPA
jgi:MFS family permease